VKRSLQSALQVLVTVSLLLAVCAPSRAAQSPPGKWPEKVVRIIVAAAPGSGDDFTSRLLAPKLSDLLHQQFVVENRPGAGGVIAQTYVMKSPSDGYTMLLAGGSMAGARYVNLAATYDVLRDFTPVSLLETSQFVLVVHPSVPARNAKEYVALARSQPGKMTYATIGAGQIPYWAAILFNNMAGIKAVEIVYKGIGEAMSDVIAGRVDYHFAPSSAAVAYKDRLRPLAVTGMTRSSGLPDVPTMSEVALPGYDMPAWRSIMGPAGVRPDIVSALNAAIARALEMQDVREKMRNVGSEPAPSSPDELSKRYVDWIGRFGKIAKEAGIKPQ
jgi:tripartite-type tricarboxylate transporter receptor subunit TctC